VNPMEAVPYPGVREVINRIIAAGKTHVIMISGRRAEEVRDLLAVQPAPEIWGVHGRQRLSPDGSSTVEPLRQEEQQALAAAAAWIEDSGYPLRTETKPGCLAIHWRGLPEMEIARVSHAAREAMRPIAERAEMSLLDFDGGIELRPREPNKGSVVRRLIGERRHPTAFAFLGDDKTDEDAFMAMRDANQEITTLSVLVRPEWRETAADLWLRPPQQLLEFLTKWAEQSEAGR
jgi:trehalose 6-phosphate phosphatase